MRNINRIEISGFTNNTNNTNNTIYISHRNLEKNCFNTNIIDGRTTFNYDTGERYLSIEGLF
jgi:hypothetical protein